MWKHRGQKQDNSTVPSLMLPSRGSFIHSFILEKFLNNFINARINSRDESNKFALYLVGELGQSRDDSKIIFSHLDAYEYHLHDFCPVQIFPTLIFNIFSFKGLTFKKLC